MLAVKVTKAAQTELALPIVFVQQKNGPLLFCFSYRRRNAARTMNSYRVPQMDECIDFLGDARTFFTLDVNSAY